MKSNSPGTVADYYAEFFASEDTPAVFQLSGGMIAFLADAIHRRGQTPIITNRHEQASGFAAEGATRVTGKTCVALGTSGPGASNLVTAIASCYFDSVPVLFVTGQIDTNEIKKSHKQRQNGFQELDICSMVKGVTKATYSPRTVIEAIDALHDAWVTAHEGRLGPVLIDLPIDVQQMKVGSIRRSNSRLLRSAQGHISDELFNLVNSNLENSKRPLILAGGGIRLDNAVDSLTDFAKQTKIPVLSTLMGLDTVTSLGDLFLGFIGSYGNRWANEILSDSDLLIVLGCRLDPRQTGNSVEQFKNGKTIIRVDIDESELNGRVNAEIKIKSAIKDFLSDSRLNRTTKKSQDMLSQVLESKSKIPQSNEQLSNLPMNPNSVLERISMLHPESAGYVVDVGQHQMWAAQSIQLTPNQRFLTSGGLGAMGFSLPAAIGAALATKNEWVVILGDGCAQLSAPELQTISEMNLPITIYVINNNQHGMVAQFQDENMQSRYVGTRFGYSTPDFCKLARAYGFNQTFNVNCYEDFPKLENFLILNPKVPILVNVLISENAKALPKLKHSE